MKKVTIQDVAKELNLSRNTVAKALNNSDTVAYETRYVVIKKAYEMGYSKLLPAVRNEFKIKDRLIDTKTVIVLARRELSTFWNRIIMGISDELNKNNCKLEFEFISEEDEVNISIPENLTRDADGMIILSVFSEAYTKRLLEFDIPVVFLDAPQDIAPTCSVGDVVLFEGRSSVKKMTESMIAEGARQIAFIGDITYCKSIYERYQGYCMAMREAGLTVDEELVIKQHVPKKYYDYEEVRAAIESFPYMPQGIVCANDDIAKDVITYLKEKQIQIPNDVMISGFDNKDETAFLTPSLTTAYISNQRMGKRLVQQLMWRIENIEMPHELITVNTEVIYRDSTNRHK